MPSSQALRVARGSQKRIPDPPCGHTKRPSFETVGNRQQSVAVPPSSLQVAAFAAKTNTLARKGSVPATVLRDRTRPVESRAADRWTPAGDPDARADGSEDHRLRCSRMRRRLSGSADPRPRKNPRGSTELDVNRADVRHSGILSSPTTSAIPHRNEIR